MWSGRLMGLSVFATVFAVTMVLVLPAISTPDKDVPLAGPIETYAAGSSGALSGTYLSLADFDALDAPAELHGMWFTEPVVVLKLRTDLLEPETAAVALPWDADHSLVGYSSKSTHLGCIVRLFGVANPDFTSLRFDRDQDGVSDGLLIDPCHQGLWDPYNQGAQIPGRPGDGPLWPLELTFRADGTLIGSARI